MENKTKKNIWWLYEEKLWYKSQYKMTFSLKIIRQMMINNEWVTVQPTDITSSTFCDVRQTTIITTILIDKIGLLIKGLFARGHICFVVWFELAGRDGDVDAEVAVVGEQLRDGGVEDEAVRVHDGGRDAFVNRPRCRFPRKTTSVSVQFQSEY